MTSRFHERIQNLSPEQQMLLAERLREHQVLDNADVADRPELIAYVVPKSGREAAIDRRDLRQHLQAQLPDYMVPATFVSLPELPQLPNGKVALNQLPAPTQVTTETNEAFIAPRTPTEQILTEIWSTVLGLDCLSIHDNFFELGGDSILSIQILSMAREAGLDLMPNDLLQHATIAELAALSNQAETTSSHVQQPREASETTPTYSLITLQPHGDQRPFFFIPGGGGGSDRELITYARFLNALGSNQPVYGLRARGLDGSQACHTTIQAMATDYITEMRTVQAEGPYLVGGECIGGLIAYEIAQQLTGQGESIGLVALLDTEPFTNLDEQRYYLKKFLFIDRGTAYLKKIANLSPREQIAQIATRSKEKLIAKVQPQTQPQISEADQQLRKVSQNYWAMASRYRPQPYSGPVTLITTQASIQTDQASRWETFALGGLETHVLPGDHTSYIREDYRTTAATLKCCLEKAHQPAAIPPTGGNNLVPQG